MRALLFGYLFSFARRTITQALVALGLTEHDWSAYYRLFNEPRIAYEELTGWFLEETLCHVPQGEIQCWSKHSATLAVRWQAWAYGVLVLAGYRVWGLGRGPIRPPGR